MGVGVGGGDGEKEQQQCPGEQEVLLENLFRGHQSESQKPKEISHSHILRPASQLTH